MTTYVMAPSDAVIQRTVDALWTQTNIGAVIARNKEEALGLLIAKIPEGAELFPSTSITLEQIGFVDYLAKNTSRYKNLRDLAAKETDPARRTELRRRFILADYFVGSVHAVTENGEVVIASRTGSQVGAYAYGARNVIWVIGAQKIVPTLDDAIRRVREHALLLETQRIRNAGSKEDSKVGKLLIFENEGVNGRVSAILVKENLGF